MKARIVCCTVCHVVVWSTFLQLLLSGLTFVLTGELDTLDRDSARAMIQDRGGRVVSAISGKVNYLVAGEQPGVSKMAKVGEEMVWKNTQSGHVVCFSVLSNLRHY